MINTVGSYLISRAFLSGMVGEGWGRIINLSSAASLGTPGPLTSAYATSKVALNQFTRHLASELDGTGVTANVVHPGDVKTAANRPTISHDSCSGTSVLAPPFLAAHSGDRRSFQMWEDIKNKALSTGAEGLVEWAAAVDETGGDPPEASAKVRHCLSLVFSLPFFAKTVPFLAVLQARDRHHRGPGERPLPVDRRADQLPGAAAVVGGRRRRDRPEAVKKRSLPGSSLPGFSEGRTALLSLCGGCVLWVNCGSSKCMCLARPPTTVPTKPSPPALTTARRPVGPN